MADEGGTNVDCARGHNSVTLPGVGIPDPCVDNQFHGTRVAGTVGAQANGIGVVGVAPNVTLVPVKVCDTSGYCYASAVVDVITGTMALGSHSEKAGYSNYGSGMTDVAAPGGNGTTGAKTTRTSSLSGRDARASRRRLRARPGRSSHRS